MIRSLSRPQLLVDAVMAVIALLARTVLGYDGAVAFWMTVGMAGALFLRRLSPGIALGLAWCTVAVQLSASLPPDIANAAVLPVLFATAAYGSRTVRWAGLASVPIGALIATVYVLFLQSGGFDGLTSLVLQIRTGEAFQAGAPGVIGFVSAAALFGLSWVLGLLVATWRTARDGRAALRSAAAEQADARREVAVEQERTRIARDMHDVVAHSLAVVIAQADGGRYARAADPEAANEAFRTIASTARSALADVRVLLGQLRANDDADPGSDRSDRSVVAAPQPTLDDLDRLIDQLRASGLMIERIASGPTAALGPGQQLVIYRIVQESLTNVLRHGDSAIGVRIGFSWEAHAVILTVDSGLRGSRPVGAAPHGHGLDGMRERAVLAGGSFEAGEVGDRFVVCLTLPTLTASLPHTRGAMPA
ncbi:Signal transduction histidine kinase [Cryobacterium flavum]|uniref:histidine kinase n=1 Tax=Cryobacterium flavum TaxID=1424659 RepID=A0A4R8V3F7_9MICO|nr:MULTISPECIES: histidine kinase [Cryobacterium]TFB76626.1 sensor histidine kinase [Cryobacterium flavum]SDO29202.1 Signal transduction histidine kinase [Cryobacterium flavum]